jgi:hypothetical protein
MEGFGLAGLTAIIWKVVDFQKYVTNKDWNAAITQAATWLSALVVSFLAREAEFFAEVEIFGQQFGDIDWAAIVLFALGLGSTASGVYEFKKAIDNNDGARTPSLLPGASNRRPNAATEPRVGVGNQ